MKLIFNLSNNPKEASKEIKALIPYVDKDLNYTNLIPDLKTATRDLIKLIGKDVYQIIEDLYWDSATNPLTDLQEEFRITIAYPIATNGYRLYAPTNDLVHTNNGRKMRGDDNEKVPFEHLLDKDNSHQEKRYYRGLDDLIEFLDNIPFNDNPTSQQQEFENNLHTAWKESQAFKELNSLFINTVDEFNRFFRIDSRLILLKLSPGIKDCEDYQILSRIGKTKFEELKTKQKNSVPIDNETDLLLLKLIKQACVFHSLAWAMHRYSVNLYPDGVLQHYTSDRATIRGQKPALNLEVHTAKMAFEEDAAKALIAIEQLVAPPVIIDEKTTIQPKIIYGDKFISA